MDDKTFYYALRLTPYPNNDTKVSYCRQLISSFMDTIDAQEYLFGQEFEKNHHFHIVFSVKDEINSVKEDEIKEKLYETFEVPKDKKGNPTYSMKPVRSLEKALSYAVKDGDYDCSEGWKELSEEAYGSSHTKKHSLKTSIADLTDEYINGNINDRTLWVELGKTRAELGLPLSIRWIDEMLLSIQVKKDPSKLQEVWEDREIKLQLKSM